MAPPDAMPAITPDSGPLAVPDAGPDAGPVPALMLLAPGEAHFGHTHAELAGLWWQWVFGLPQEHHPLLDAEGDDCAVGQRDDVFFLGGTFGGPAHRECIAPAGRPFFFPVVNNVVSNALRAPDEHFSDEELSTYVREWVDGLDSFSLEIDGAMWTMEQLRAHRAASRFAYDVSDERPNLYDLRGVDFDGVVDPAFTDGIWIYLPPLSAGAHHIHFVANEAGDPELGIRPFSVDVEYDLDVR